MDSRKQTPPRVDGIYSRPKTNRQPIFRDSTLSPKPRPQTRQPAMRTAPRKSVPINAIPQQSKPSLLGMTLPNDNYTNPKALKKTKKSRFKRPWTRKRKVVTSILAVAVVFIGMSAWFGSRILGSIDKVFHGNIFSDVHALFSQKTLKGEASGRINILVAGDSSDQINHGGANLTDSIMILSLDPKNHTGFMFSIPRDLWVYIPGLNSYQKINAANDVTKFSASSYPNGGMGQLEQVIQTNLGIPIDYYALVNYGAFQDAVNAVGGITIDINSPDPRGLYDKFTNLKLPNGEDNLSGQQALNLARARGDGVAGDISYGFPNSDFTRTMYQREMVVSILKKATSAGVLTNPIKVTSLFSSLSSNVQTDLSLQDVLSLDQLVKGINYSSLGSYTYSTAATGSSGPLLVGYVDPGSGQDALSPAEGVGDFSALKAYYQQLVSSNPIAKENASIEILNGTNVTGLAKLQQSALQVKGVDSVSVGDAAGNYPTSMIVDNSSGKDPATKALLKQLYPGTVVTSPSGSIEAKEATNYSDTFVVILGQNFASTHQAGSSTAVTNSSN